MRYAVAGTAQFAVGQEQDPVEPVAEVDMLAAAGSDGGQGGGQIGVSSGPPLVAVDDVEVTYAQVAAPRAANDGQAIGVA